MGTQIPFTLTIQIDTNNSLVVKLLPKQIYFSNVYDTISFLKKHFLIARNKINTAIQKLAEKNIMLNNDKKIVLYITSTPIDIFWNDISIKKNDGSFIISIQVKNANLDLLLGNIIGNFNGVVVRDIFTVVNDNSKGKAKFELINSVMEWLCKYQLINHVIYNILCGNEKIAKIIKKYDISVKSINLDY